MKKRKNRKDYQFKDELILRRLLPDAVPSYFPGLSQYYNKTVSNRRSESTTKDVRFQKQYEANELAVQEYFAADEISSMEELQQKMETSEIPKYIVKNVAENEVTLYALKIDNSGQPHVNYSIMIKEDLQISMWCNGVEISPKKVAQHLSKEKKIHSCVGLLNILVYLKNMAEDKVLQSTNTLEYCISLLEKTVPELEEEVSKKVLFLKEQLKLAITNKYARRYSPDMLSCSAIWKNVSPALYKQIWEEGSVKNICL